MDHVKQAIAREEGSRCRFQQPYSTNTTSRITVLCEERETERKREREREPLVPPTPHLLLLFPGTVSRPPLPPSYIPLSLFSLLDLSVLQAKGRNRWFVSFLSFPSSLGLRFCHHVPRLLPRILCIEFIPVTVGLSSNQPLPFSLSPLLHMLECKFKSTRPK